MNTNRRYKFLFEDGKTFSVVASSIEEAESYLNNPLRLLTIDRLENVTLNQWDLQLYDMLTGRKQNLNIKPL